MSNTHDHTRTDDLRISAVRPLIAPALLTEELPAPASSLAMIDATRKQISDVIHGRDRRLLVVVGPCSIHDHGQAMEYGELFAAQAAALADELLLVMRVYFEKPRTTVGWKGYINDPRLDGSFRINEGLRGARKLLIDLAAIGVPSGTEFLDMLSPQYISDLVAWGAIGARTTESQGHRQLASGLSCPVGFKNGTDGSISVVTDALITAASGHAFMGMTKLGQAAVFETRGNSDCHAILRGGKAPNYDSANIDLACAQLQKSGVAPLVMVDCSHANSQKSHEKQLQVVSDIAGQIGDGENRIFGVMIESHLQAGRQDLVAGQSLLPGVSITDACLGWQQTVPALHLLAQAVAKARHSH